MASHPCCRMLCLAFLISVISCGDGDDEDKKDEKPYACLYDFKVDSFCNWGITYGKWRSSCLRVRTPEDCTDYTKNSTSSFSGCSTNYSYTNVSVQKGACPETSSTPPDNSTPDKKVFGALCSSSSECESGSNCVGTQQGAPGFCSPPCSNNTDCYYSGTGTGVCLLDLNKDGEVDHCIVMCTQESDCMSGLTCYSFSDGNVCMP